VQVFWQNPQDYFLVPEDSLKKVSRIQMLKITFALGVDQVSVQTKIEVFELQILTLCDTFVDGNIR